MITIAQIKENRIKELKNDMKTFSSDNFQKVSDRELKKSLFKSHLIRLEQLSK